MKVIFFFFFFLGTFLGTFIKIHTFHMILNAPLPADLNQYMSNSLLADSADFSSTSVLRKPIRSNVFYDGCDCIDQPEFPL